MYNSVIKFNVKDEQKERDSEIVSSLPKTCDLMGIIFMFAYLQWCTEISGQLDFSSYFKLLESKIGYYEIEM